MVALYILACLAPCTPDSSDIHSSACVLPTVFPSLQAQFLNTLSVLPMRFCTAHACAGLPPFKTRHGQHCHCCRAKLQHT